MAGTSLKESNANIEMTKTLLDYVDRLGSNTNFWFGADRGRGRSRGRGQRERKIGSSNIRNLASMAVNAECYKEFRLFIEYKKGKGNGWNDHFENGKVFGDVLLEYMDEIYKKCNYDDDETLKQVSRLFGYLYWKVRAMEE